MIQSSKGVFLSYASEDAGVAQRICAALRIAGMEVWFDQSELRGGDAWDQKIRQQIRDCALFVPIISAHTQTRPEGYFRLEWKLAVDRSHLMAAEKTFLVPVVADATTEPEALVPAQFREVQWTRIQTGEVLTAFVDRIAALLKQPVANHVGSPERGVNRAPTKRFPIVLIALSVVAVVGLMIATAIRGGWLGHKPVAKVEAGTADALVATTPAAISEKSVAVLPFVDMSEKQDEGYLSDGLSEELIDMLTKVPDLRVPARTSSFYFKGKQTTVADIAKALNVAQVLEGSVRKSGNQLRITVQLVRVADGFHVWSHTYDRKLEDIFKLQDDIAGAVVTALRSSLANGSGLRVSTTQNSEAFAHYLRARDIDSGASTLGEIEQAAEHLRTAVKLDPGFTLGWTSLAGVLVSEVIFGERHNDNELLTELRNANQKALALGPEVATVQVVNAEIQSTIDWNWAAAALSMKKAYAADSTDSDNCAGLATALFKFGRDDATSIGLLKKAIALDPLNDYNYIFLAQQYFVIGRLSEAEAALREAVRLSPLNLDSNRSLGDVLIAEGKPNEALAIYQSKLPAGNRLRGAAIAYFELGRHGDAQAALDELEKNYATGFAYSIAAIHSRRRELGEAFSWLERAYVLHDSALPDVNRDPWLKNLHHDSRWRVFLQKMNLPEIPNR